MNLRFSSLNMVGQVGFLQEIWIYYTNDGTTIYNKYSVLPAILVLDSDPRLQAAHGSLILSFPIVRGTLINRMSISTAPITSYVLRLISCGVIGATSVP